MRRLPISALMTACVAAAQFVTPVPSVMPSWVAPYPGVSAESRRNGNSVESTYTAGAAPHDVLSHYRSLFVSAGVPFRPDPQGGGFLIRANVPECDLEIVIRGRYPDSTVKVTCSPRLEANERMIELRARERADHAQDNGMTKFDTPVYPTKSRPAPLQWPSWLVRVDGARLPVEKLPGMLKSSFTSQPTREAIQQFYADLLSSHHYRVAQGVSPVPEKFGSWVQGTNDSDDELARRVVIWVKIRPVGQNFTVELSLQ